MIDKVKDLVQNSRLLQFTLVLIFGIAIGAIAYPTKRIEEREKSKYQEELKIVNESHDKLIKQITSEIDKTTSEYKQYRSNSEQKISKLTYQIHDLRSKQKTSYYKIVRPDGTVEIKKYSETDVSESTQTIDQIQQEFKRQMDSITKQTEELHKKQIENLQHDFDSKERSYQNKITELEKSKVEEINQKHFGLEVGMNTNMSYYGHATADLFGPFFAGVQTDISMTPSFGLGIGIRF
jgi:uncharacterized protein (DUF3084 family)